MRANNFLRFLLIVLAFCCACNQNEMPALSLIKWVETAENGVVKQKNIGNWELKVQYEPPTYLQAKAHTPINRKSLNTPNNLHYFRFTIDLADVSKNVLKEGIYTTQEYLHRIQYFSFGMERDLYLVTEGDTLKPALFHYERNYGLKREHTFSVAFEIPKLEKNKCFVWNAKELKLGIVKICFKGVDLIKANELRLN